MRDQSAAENIVQDVFVKFWENRTGLNINVSLKSYLYTSVKNHCLNFIKRENVLNPFDENTEIVATMTDAADGQLEKSELIRDVHDAVSRLPGKCREIFVMCKFDGLSYKEIAEVQNISINTVKTQLRRAMKYLSENLIHLRSFLIIMQYYFFN